MTTTVETKASPSAANDAPACVVHFAPDGRFTGAWRAAQRRCGYGKRAAGTERPMQLFRQFLARVRAWRAARRALNTPADILTLVAFQTFQTGIHREVTPSGVRVFSLCGTCGARLEASATLCEECAQRRSRLL
jgi:hypothetical protein